MSIEYIFFDLGKVILKFDHAIGLNKLAAVTGQPAAELESLIFETGLQRDFETGLISATEFHSRFCQATQSSISASELLLGCSDIFTLNASIMPLIGQLAAVGFPVGILSNTCVAHWAYVFQRYTFLRDSFRDYVLSFEAKSMKPDRPIYDVAITAAGVAAGSIFFVDDRQENVDGALAAGIDAVLYRCSGELIEQLQQRGLRFNL